MPLAWLKKKNGQNISDMFLAVVEIEKFTYI